MLDKEFNLSEKRKLDCISMDKIHHYVYSEPDIKEFIKIEDALLALLFAGRLSNAEFCRRRRKLAGDKLI